MTSSLPLSPIVLSTLYSEEKKVNISAKLNRDVFNIYQIKNGTSNLNYCKQIVHYMKNHNSSNDYYSCKHSGNCDTPKNNTFGDTKYIVIEFPNSTSQIVVDNVTYNIKKITFRTPSYHYVNTDSKYDISKHPDETHIMRRELNSDNGAILFNCLEIEILCENILNQKLSVSILCNTNQKDESSDKTLESDEENTRQFFKIINKYIKDENNEQLWTGGYKDKSFNLDIHNILPINRHFFKYNGTAFETNPLTNNTTAEKHFYNITRIVFKNSITVPYIFFTHLQNLTSSSNTTCSEKNNISISLNQFVDLQPEKHSLVFSDTNIDFISNNNRPKKNKNIDLYLQVLFGFILCLLLLIIFVWLWSINYIQSVIKILFFNN